MRTYASDILEIATIANREAIECAGRDHSPQEFKDLLIRLGSAVEVFLKDYAYTGLKNRAKFADLIDGLDHRVWFRTTERSFMSCAITTTRPNMNPLLAEIQSVLAILRGSECALEKLITLPIGSMHLASSKPIRRLLWFAAWDHFIGGDTEISIFLPCSPEIDMPYGFETIYTGISSWDQIKTDLANVGELDIGPEHLPSNVYRFWSGEGDFLAAGTAEGGLRAMISVLARYERVEDLTPDAKRENAPYSMLAAALSVVTDLSQQRAFPEGIKEQVLSLLL